MQLFQPKVEFFGRHLKLLQSGTGFFEHVMMWVGFEEFRLVTY